MKLTKKQVNTLTTNQGKLRSIILDKFVGYPTKEFSTITRTGYYSGSGRFTTACSFMVDFTSFLDAMKIKYTTGNDAPRGGVSGEYVKISSRAVTKLNKIVSELL